jgi:uncharacterized protein (DUF2141 family)
MKNIVNLLLLGFIFSGFCFAQADINVVIEINNIAVNGGTVHLAIFSSADSFRKETPEYGGEVPALNAVMTFEITLPAGEYVITAYQDANNNGRIDIGLFGIPRELVGVSNYFGRGFPSQNFERQKVKVDRTSGRVVLNLYKFF